MSECFNCNDVGMVGGCPVCGKSSSPMDSEVKHLEELAESVEINFIPEDYKKLIWNPDILISDLSARPNGHHAEAYVKRMSKYLRIYQKGLTPTGNLLICSDAASGKTILTYNIIRVVSALGDKVAPIIDNMEYRRLCNLSSDIKMYKNYIKTTDMGYDLDTIINADFVCMRIDPLGVLDSHRDIISLINKRTSRGKPTLFISNYTPKQIACVDYEKEFSNYLNAYTSDNPKRLSLLNFFSR